MYKVYDLKEYFNVYYSKWYQLANAFVSFVCEYILFFAERSLQHFMQILICTINNIPLLIRLLSSIRVHNKLRQTIYA